MRTDTQHLQQVPIRVAVVDPNALMREGVCALLRVSDELEPCGAWGDAVEALRSIRKAPPDVLLLDVKLPGQSSYELLKALPRVSPGTRTLVMVDCLPDDCVVLNPPRVAPQPEAFRVIPRPFSQPDDCLQLALKMGAHGVIHKHCSFDYLTQAIRTVQSGQYWMEFPTANRLAEQYIATFRPSPVTTVGADTLTLRERQVAALVAQGRSNKEIARELRLGYSTVKNYVSSILQKLELRDRTQIALYSSDPNAFTA
jgi:DNA-binding NarL/FixJ family response regulator